MYAIGDLVIYGAEGVFRVVDIGCPEMVPTQDREYYTLVPLYSCGKTYTPTDSSIRLRPVISEGEARQLIRRIPNIPADLCEENNVHRLTSLYKEMIQTYDCENLIRLIRSIHAKGETLTQNGKKLGQVDEKYLKRAEDMLHEEFSVALGIPKEDVKQYIEESAENLGTAAGTEP